MQVQRNKAVVGLNAFAHEAGIHQDGYLKNATTYEIISPETVGMPANHIVLGKHSGRHALANRYRELGYDLTKPEIDRAYELFTQLADRKKNVYDEDLISIVNESFKHNPELYTLKLLESVASSEGRSTATIELERDGQSFRESATAEGPCDAAFRAIDRITGTPGTVVDFSVHSISAGADSTAEVSIRAQFQGKEFTGKSLSYNVIEAAARAYLQAANKGVYEIRRTVGHATADGRSIHENELVDRLFPGGY
jgi:2-isopropylmalate synthase